MFRPHLKMFKVYFWLLTHGSFLAVLGRVYVLLKIEPESTMCKENSSPLNYHLYNTAFTKYFEKKMRIPKEDYFFREFNLQRMLALPDPLLLCLVGIGTWRTSTNVNLSATIDVINNCSCV